MLHPSFLIKAFSKDEEGLWKYKTKYVIPDDAIGLQVRLMTIAHSHLLAGHFLVLPETLDRLKQFYWTK